MPYKNEFSPNAKYFKPIDWLQVQHWTDEGLTGIEIAKRIGVHPNCFYKRVYKEHGWYWTHWKYKRYLVRRGLDFEIRGVRFHHDPYPHIQTLK